MDIKIVDDDEVSSRRPIGEAAVDLTPSLTPDSPTYVALEKFAANEPLYAREWIALSELSLADRSRPEWEPGNVRWAATPEERADNERFFRSLRGYRRLGEEDCYDDEDDDDGLGCCGCDDDDDSCAPIS